MNLGVIVYMLGWIMKVEGLLMLVPVLTAAVYREKEGFCYLAVAVLCVLLGAVFLQKKAGYIRIFRQGRICDGLPGLGAPQRVRLPALYAQRGDPSLCGRYV